MKDRNGRTITAGDILVYMAGSHRQIAQHYVAGIGRTYSLYGLTEVPLAAVDEWGEVNEHYKFDFGTGSIVDRRTGEATCSLTVDPNAVREFADQNILPSRKLVRMVGTKGCPFYGGHHDD